MLVLDEEKRMTIEDVLLQLNVIPSDDQIKMEIAYDYPDYFEKFKIKEQDIIHQMEDRDQGQFNKSSFNQNTWKIVEIKEEYAIDDFGSRYKILEKIYEPIDSSFSKEDLIMKRRSIWKDVIIEQDKAPQGPLIMIDDSQTQNSSSIKSNEDLNKAYLYII